MLLLPTLLLACSDMPEGEPRVVMEEPARVWAFHSADLQTWEKGAEPVVESFESLGLGVSTDGELWLTGLDMGTMATWWERNIGGPRLDGLVSRDGRRWERADWSVSKDVDGAWVDPQWFEDEVWYVHHEGTGDPVAAGHLNQVRTAPGDAEMATGEGYADPSPVRFKGERFVYVTAHPLKVAVLAGEPLQVKRHLAGVSVPFATVVGDELWLLAQAVVQGRRRPVYARSTDGLHFGNFTPFDLPAPQITCTSPVMAPTSQGWVLLCVEESVPVGRAGGGRPAGRDRGTNPHPPGRSP